MNDTLKSYGFNNIRYEPPAWDAELRRNYANSLALDANIDIPRPDGLEDDYYPYQKAGIAYALERAGTLIGDDMGVGKTIQAIGVINSLPRQEVEDIIIGVPAFLIPNWQSELSKWLAHSLSIGVASGKYVPNTNIVLISYGILHKHSLITRTVWDVAIFDECHRLKSEKTIRGKTLKKIKAKRRLALSGTPAKNTPKDFWNIVHWVCPRIWQSRRLDFEPYIKRRAWAELNTRLRATCMIRRMKSEVRKDLPPKIRQVVVLPIAGLEKLVNEELTAHQREVELKSELKKAKQTVAHESTGDFQKEIHSLEGELHKTDEHISKLRQKVALAKMPYVIEHVKESLQVSNKIIVFAHHKRVIDEFYKHFKDMSLVIDGRVPPMKRQGIANEFAFNPNRRILIGGITAIGEGMNLTVASHGIFIEEDWVPSTVVQCEDRMHRDGQSDSVLIQHLALEGSVEMYVAKAMISKQQLLEKAVDGK